MEKYAYHLTYIHRLPSIAKIGLVPGNTLGLDGKWDVVWFCDNYFDYEVVDAQRDVKIRFPWPSGEIQKHSISDFGSTRIEYSVEGIIPANNIEVLIGSRWVNLIDVILFIENYKNPIIPDY